MYHGKFARGLAVRMQQSDNLLKKETGDYSSIKEQKAADDYFFFKSSDVQ
jgi:hypothetical protein